MLLIFDCDGVLVDSEILSCRIDAELLTELGFPYTVDDIVSEFVGSSLKDQVRIIEERHGRSLPADFGERLNKTLLARFETELQPIPGIRKTVTALPYPRCVASSSTPHRIETSLRITGLLDLFDHRFSSTEVTHGKPAPDLFLHAASQMGFAPADCIVVEDSRLGVQAAKAAGMRVIGFMGGGHCGMGHADVLSGDGADHVITRMDELAGGIEILRTRM